MFALQCTLYNVCHVSFPPSFSPPRPVSLTRLPAIRLNFSCPASLAPQHAAGCWFVQLMVCMITMGSEDKVKEFAKVVEDNKPST